MVRARVRLMVIDLRRLVASKEPRLTCSLVLLGLREWLSSPGQHGRGYIGFWVRGWFGLGFGLGLGRGLGLGLGRV